MKKLNYLWLLLFLCFACEEEGGTTPEPDEETLVEQQLALLESTTWVPGSITKDGSDLISEYLYFADFELTFNGSLNADRTALSSGSYTTKDEGEVLNSGPWSFKVGDEANTIVMSGLDVAYEVSETSLRLEFVRSEDNARTTAISGEYVFNLVPQN
jgi:hypothetical protein